MPSNSNPDDHVTETVDALLLDGDHATRGWRRRAVGMPRDQALDQIPRVGMLQCQIPIEPLRTLQRHIRLHDLNQARWVRQAIIEKYLREGGDPDIATAANTMRHDHPRRRDVPRDQLGQSRRRQGRK